MLQSGATAAPAWSTATYPATTTANQILYSSAANTVGGLATGNSSVLVTSAGGVPSLATDIPTAVTIGGKYVYRADGTDVPIADGGTNSSAALTNNKVMHSVGGAIVESATTSTELGYLSGVTSAIQTQFNNRPIVYYGHMYNNGTTQSVTILATGSYVRVPGSFTGGETSGTTFQNSRELVVTNAGTYSIHWSMSIASAVVNQRIAGTFMVDNVASALAASSGFSTTNTRSQTVSGSAIVTLGANAVISLGVANLDAIQNVNVYYGSLTVNIV